MHQLDLYKHVFFHNNNKVNLILLMHLSGSSEKPSSTLLYTWLCCVLISCISSFHRCNFILFIPCFMEHVWLLLINLFISRELHLNTLKSYLANNIFMYMIISLLSILHGFLFPIYNFELELEVKIRYFIAYKDVICQMIEF